MEHLQLVELFGEDAVKALSHRLDLQKQIEGLRAEQANLEAELRQSFSVNLSLTDILVATIAGVMCGAMSGLFKSFIPQHGDLKHEHSTTRTAIDYKVPKPEGMKGSTQGLHRQIGPGHDLGRFKEALDLISGKTKDFPLWGKTIAEQTGGVLHAGNMRVDDFLAHGGFKIPEDPKKELLNHLLIDFFTKTSLPIPFTSYIADHSQSMAKIMMGMYDNGLNLKNLVGNVSSSALLHIIICSYVYLFKSAKAVDLYGRLGNVKSAKEFGDLFSELNKENKRYLKSKDFNVLQAIAHGSSFLVDTIITVASKNYAGLFALDYGTLIFFATDVIKYVKKSMDSRKDTLKKLSSISENLLALDDAWYDTFKEDMLSLAKKDGFYEAFDPEVIIEKHAAVIRRLEAGHDRRSDLLTELKEWKVDEDS